MLRRPKPGQLEAILQKWQPQIEALEAAQIQRPAFTAARAEALTEGLVRHFVPLTPLAVKAFERQRWKEYGGVWISMHDRLWLFVAAEEAFLADVGEQGVAYLSLLEEVGSRMQGLLVWAQILAQVDEDIAETLTDIAQPRDMRDPADEAVRLVSVLRASQGLLGDAFHLSEEALLPLDQAAEALLQVLDSASLERLAPAQDRLFRAYTIWREAFLLLTMMGRFLDRNQYDAEQKFPLPLPKPIPPVSPS